MRPLVSYDDIASQVPEQASPPPNSGAASPPKKRRKNNPRQSQRYGSHRIQYRNEDHGG